MDDGMTGELIFDNCRVPLATIWGKEGEGFYLYETDQACIRASESSKSNQ
jgi:alkylation response protein AidB-like acyl-CoA dehydrogenase